MLIRFSVRPVGLQNKNNSNKNQNKKNKNNTVKKNAMLDFVVSVIRFQRNLDEGIRVIRRLRVRNFIEIRSQVSELFDLKEVEKCTVCLDDAYYKGYRPYDSNNIGCDNISMHDFDVGLFVLGTCY